jgi:hypothetical protein
MSFVNWPIAEGQDWCNYKTLIQLWFGLRERNAAAEGSYQWPRKIQQVWDAGKGETIVNNNNGTLTLTDTDKDWISLVPPSCSGMQRWANYTCPVTAAFMPANYDIVFDVDIEDPSKCVHGRVISNTINSLTFTFDNNLIVGKVISNISELISGTYSLIRNGGVWWSNYRTYFGRWPDWPNDCELAVGIANIGWKISFTVPPTDPFTEPRTNPANTTVTFAGGQAQAVVEIGQDYIIVFSDGSPPTAAGQNITITGPRKDKKVGVFGTYPVTSVVLHVVDHEKNWDTDELLGKTILIFGDGLHRTTILSNTATAMQLAAYQIGTPPTTGYTMITVFFVHPGASYTLSGVTYSIVSTSSGVVRFGPSNVGVGQDGPTSFSAEAFYDTAWGNCKVVWRYTENGQIVATKETPIRLFDNVVTGGQYSVMASANGRGIPGRKPWEPLVWYSGHMEPHFIRDPAGSVYASSQVIGSSAVYWQEKDSSGACNEVGHYDTARGTAMDWDAWIAHIENEDEDGHGCELEGQNLSRCLYKTLRSVQAGIEELCGYFVPVDDYHLKKSIPEFTFSTLLYRLGINAGSSTVVGPVRDGDIVYWYFSVTPRFRGVPIHYTIINRQDGTADSGNATPDATTGRVVVKTETYSVDGNTWEHDGRPVRYTGGWTRYIQRDVRKLYETGAFIPSVKSDPLFGASVVYPPAVQTDPDTGDYLDYTGEFWVHKQSTRYREYDDRGFIVDGKEFAAGHSALYIGDLWHDAFPGQRASARVDSNPLDVEYSADLYEGRYENWRVSGQQASQEAAKRGTVTASTSQWLEDNTKNWYTMPTGGGIASTHQYNDVTISATQIILPSRLRDPSNQEHYWWNEQRFYNAYGKPFLNWIAEMDRSGGQTLRTPIIDVANFQIGPPGIGRSITLTLRPIVEPLGAGTHLRLVCPRRTINRWRTCRVKITEPGGTVRYIEITHSDRNRLYFEPVGFTIPVGSTYEIMRHSTGTVWTFTTSAPAANVEQQKVPGGYWVRPTGLDDCDVPWVDRRVNNIPDREVRFGKIHKGDLITFDVLNEMYRAIRELVWTKRAFGWQSLRSLSQPENHWSLAAVYFSDFGQYGYATCNQYNLPSEGCGAYFGFSTAKAALTTPDSCTWDVDDAGGSLDTALVYNPPYRTISVNAAEYLSDQGVWALCGPPETPNRLGGLGANMESVARYTRVDPMARPFSCRADLFVAAKLPADVPYGTAPYTTTTQSLIPHGGSPTFSFWLVTNTSVVFNAQSDPVALNAYTFLETVNPPEPGSPPHIGVRVGDPARPVAPNAAGIVTPDTNFSTTYNIPAPTTHPQNEFFSVSTEGYRVADSVMILRWNVSGGMKYV